MDSNYLRQMSLQNAQMALEQAKLEYQSHSIDLQNMYTTLAKRINGGGEMDLEAQKDKFYKENKILTIQNYKNLVGERYHYRGEEWRIVDVTETPTLYTIHTTGPILNLYTIELSRVADKRGGYSLTNMEFGTTCRVDKDIIRSKGAFIRKIGDVTDLPF